MAYQALSTIYKVAAYNRAQRRGDVTRIAEETGYTVSMVSKTLRGLRSNIQIVNKAYRLVRERQTNLQRLTSATA